MMKRPKHKQPACPEARYFQPQVETCDDCPWDYTESNSAIIEETARKIGVKLPPRNPPEGWCVLYPKRRKNLKYWVGPIALLWWDGKSVGEIAHEMGCSETTVRRRLRDADTFFGDSPVPRPYTPKRKRSRNDHIRDLRRMGRSVQGIAAQFAITRQRVWQILGPKEVRTPRRKRRPHNE